MHSIIFVFIILAIELSQCAVANARVVTINVVTEDSVALQYKEKGKIVGPATDIVTKAIEQAGFSYDIQMLPWSRAYKMALTQKNTLIYSLARTAEREDKFHWIGKIMKLDYYLFGYENLPIDNNTSMDVLKNYRIGAARDSAVYHYLSNLQFNHLQVVGHGKQNFSKLVQHRIDLFPANLSSFKAGCKHFKVNCRRIKPLYKLDLASSALYFAMNKSSDIEIVKDLQAAHRQLKQ